MTNKEGSEEEEEAEGGGEELTAAEGDYELTAELAVETFKRPPVQPQKPQEAGKRRRHYCDPESRIDITGPSKSSPPQKPPFKKQRPRSGIIASSIPSPSPSASPPSPASSTGTLSPLGLLGDGAGGADGASSKPASPQSAPAPRSPTSVVQVNIGSPVKTHIPMMMI